jgi:hypothetical protein
MNELNVNSVAQTHQMSLEVILKDAEPEETHGQVESDNEYDDSEQGYDDQNGTAEEPRTDPQDKTVNSWEDPEIPWSR